MKTAQQAQKLKESHDSHFADSERLMQFLQNSTSHISDFLSGVLTSEQKDWKLSVGHLVRAFIKDKLLAHLGVELKKFKDEGVIKQDFLESDVNRTCFKEILEFIDSESPDEVRFSAMKSVLLSSLEIGSDLGSEVVAHELMKLCGQLSFMEIKILRANFSLVTQVRNNEEGSSGRDIHDRGVKHWGTTIASLIGHSVPEMVLLYEEHLTELQLISGRDYSASAHGEASTFLPTQHFRLTGLGYLLCEHITKYE